MHAGRYNEWVFSLKTFYFKSKPGFCKECRGNSHLRKISLHRKKEIVKGFLHDAECIVIIIFLKRF